MLLRRRLWRVRPDWVESRWWPLLLLLLCPVFGKYRTHLLSRGKLLLLLLVWPGIRGLDILLH